MTITQTVEIPVSHRLTIDVPREIPTGSVILTFTPAKAERIKERGFGCAKGQFRMAEEIAYINRNAEWLNKQAEDSLELQDIDAVYDDLEQLTPQMLDVMHDTVVPINLADLVGIHDIEG